MPSADGGCHDRQISIKPEQQLGEPHQVETSQAGRTGFPVSLSAAAACVRYHAVRGRISAHLHLALGGTGAPEKFKNPRHAGRAGADYRRR
ncbi:hypothetical protein OPT61_g8488 [Boeremia exigua]|uniref:Uncharacterized protein n=1 Tax=Boeremia exigua TaxID=749465 RepID=A0ACC2HY27_9PLEO|nr:hypothetical protein OPT61_g8488 [Boeremia exigua]